MRFFSSLIITVATAIMVSGADAATDALNATDIQTMGALSVQINQGNFYGAPLPPWKQDCKPGWYYGDYPNHVPPNFPGLPWLKDSHLCWLLDFLSCGFHCPKPPHHQHPPPPNDGYKPVFSNYSGAVQAADYMTYGLVDTVEACKDMCDSVEGCIFINPYHDVNGKNGSPLLTCSLFSKCHTIADADNRGGQTQPDGSVDFITDSAGFCKTK
ncbi:hypothetical protein DFS33DRAFT_1250223 [Desarmillaria ectypa]|nr:hypothetical protein DFS33DRAFT_1250223 [Desarmillaria ectypa]